MATRTRRTTEAQAIAGLLKEIAETLDVSLSVVPSGPLHPGAALDVKPVVARGLTPRSAPAGRARARDLLDAADELIDEVTAPLEPESLPPAAGPLLDELVAIAGTDQGQLGIALTWQVRDASQQLELVPGRDFAAQAGTDPLGFSLLMRPRFVEMTRAAHAGIERDGIPSTTEVRVVVSVAVTYDDGTLSVTSDALPLPPIAVPVVDVAVPRMLILFRHADFEPVEQRNGRAVEGAAVVIVPESGPVDGTQVLASEVLGLLDLQRLTEAAPRLPLPGFGELLAGQIRNLAAIVSRNEPHVGVVRASEIPVMNRVDFIAPRLLNDIELEREVSSLILVGPPGSRVRLFSRRQFRQDAGALTVKTAPVGLITFVHRLGNPPSALPTETVTVDPQPDAGTFDERLRSLRFL